MNNIKNIKYSIIIPTLNQSSKLMQCLSHLSQLSFEPDLFEVLVIDNGSTDNTKEISLSFQGKIKNCRYIFCESPGLMAARHRGCYEANGEILCYIDDDSLVTTDWLKGLAVSFSNKKVILVGGPCIPIYEVEPPEWIEYFWQITKYGKFNGFLSLVDFGENNVHYIPPNYVFGCNYSIRKKILLNVGGTYPDYLPHKYMKYQGSGETAIAHKIEKSGITLYNPKVKIRHIVPKSRMTIDYFCWRAYFQGIGSSFMNIRRKNNIDITNKGSKKEKLLIIFLKKIIRQILLIFGKIKNFIFPNEPKDIRDIKDKINGSRKKGFAYHQAEVKKDPKLLEWVLRKNYLGRNGELPR